MSYENVPLPFITICGDCKLEDGEHAYWCGRRKTYATDRQQGA